MPFKLYDLPAEAEAIEILLVESGGELSPELEQRLNEFVQGGKEKLEASACVLMSLNAQADACKSESKRLAARQHALEANADKLKGLMLMAIDGAFNGKVKTSLFTLYAQTSAGTATFELAQGQSLMELPNEFIKIEAPTLDTGELWRAWREKRPLPDGVEVSEVPGKRSLRIK